VFTKRPLVQAGALLLLTAALLAAIATHLAGMA
jgi:hypothetical protein